MLPEIITPEITAPKIEPLFTAEAIHERVKELADEITADYQNEEPVLVGVLKGSFIFLADLARETNLHALQIDFMGVESYKKGTKSSRQPIITKDLSIDISDHHVLLVEDIVDTGYSLQTLMKILSVRSAKSIKTCALLSKPDRREVEVPIDFLGFTIPDEFVVGYGLDFNQKYRELPYIGILPKELQGQT